MVEVINFTQKFSKFSEHWQPRVIAEMNDYQFKLVKVQGDFVRHQHAETDEVFLVLEGELSIEFDDEILVVGRGEMVVVPKGVHHRPFSDAECKVLLVEPKGLVNTGDAGGNLTAENNAWV